MYQYLSGRLHQLGIHHEDLGEKLGMSPAAVSRRFNGTVLWSVDEIYEILEICRATPEEFPIYFPPQAKKGRGKV